MLLHGNWRKTSTIKWYLGNRLIVLSESILHTHTHTHTHLHVCVSVCVEMRGCPYTPVHTGTGSRKMTISVSQSVIQCIKYTIHSFILSVHVGVKMARRRYFLLCFDVTMIQTVNLSDLYLLHVQVL